MKNLISKSYAKKFLLMSLEAPAKFMDGSFCNTHISNFLLEESDREFQSLFWPFAVFFL